MEIFPYNDGVKDRFGDPMRIERMLEAHAGGDMKRLLEHTCSENPDIADPAEDRLTEAICAAFELERFDKTTGKGTTEQFQRELMDSFMAWREKKKANTDSLPNYPTLTGSPPPVNVYPGGRVETNLPTASG